MCGPTPCAGENGTKIIVENLFYNTPARLNYLKTDKTEQQHVVDCVQKMALSYPNIGFTLNAGWCQILTIRANGKFYFLGITGCPSKSTRDVTMRALMNWAVRTK